MITNNIKHNSTSTDQYFHGLPVNTTPDTPVYPNILDKTYRELTLLTARYTRVVLIRLDLIPPEKRNPYDIDISRFCRSFKKQLEGKSFVKDAWRTSKVEGSHLADKAKFKSKIAYGWTMEYGRETYNEGIHWHFWVALKNDDNLQPDIQAKHTQDHLIKIWEKITGGESERSHKSSWFYIERNQLTKTARLKQQEKIANGGKGVIIACGPLATRSNNKNKALGGVIDECFYTLSYLAKVYSKVRTPSSKGCRISGSSNLNTSDKRSGRQEEIEKNLDKIRSHLSKKLKPIDLVVITDKSTRY
jgi:hypothetical protein